MSPPICRLVPVPAHEVDAAAVSRGRDLLFDYLVLAARGAALPSAVAARAALQFESTTEPNGVAVVDGADLSGPADAAALANGIAAHGLELDDTYEPASHHPGVVVWPAVLAVADELNSTLGEVLDAGIAGYDAVCALGDMIDPAECYARGFHPTGVCGPIGAAAGVGRLIGLSEQEFVNAFAIGASSASGLLEFLTDGSWTKRFHAGHAAASGIRAARLAQAGFTGPPTAIEGHLGFLHAFGARADESGGADRASARGHGILGTAVKFYPCCRYMHGCIDLLIDIAVEEDVEASDVAEIRCGVLSAGWDLVAAPVARKRRIETHVDAQFSMPFGAALAITHARASLDDFSHPREFADQSAELIAATECFTSARLDSAYPSRWGAEVEVSTRGGAKLHRYEKDFRGSASRPASRDALLRKASELIDAQRVEDLLHWCADAPASSSIDEVAMLRSEPTHGRSAPSELIARASLPGSGCAV